MAEKATAKKATAAKKVAAPKATTEKKVAAPKKACATKKAAAPKTAAVVLDAINCGYKAGDVYQALAKAEKALTVAEIAKEAKISTEEVLLGLGWLFKEGKVKDENAAVTLA